MTTRMATIDGFSIGWKPDLLMLCFSLNCCCQSYSDFWCRGSPRRIPNVFLNNTYSPQALEPYALYLGAEYPSPNKVNLLNHTRVIEAPKG